MLVTLCLVTVCCFGSDMDPSQQEPPKDPSDASQDGSSSEAPSRNYRPVASSPRPSPYPTPAHSPPHSPPPTGGAAGSSNDHMLSTPERARRARGLPARSFESPQTTAQQFPAHCYQSPADRVADERERRNPHVSPHHLFGQLPSPLQSWINEAAQSSPHYPSPPGHVTMADRRAQEAWMAEHMPGYSPPQHDADPLPLIPEWNPDWLFPAAPNVGTGAWPQLSFGVPATYDGYLLPMPTPMPDAQPAQVLALFDFLHPPPALLAQGGDTHLTAPAANADAPAPIGGATNRGNASQSLASQGLAVTMPPTPSSPTDGGKGKGKGSNRRGKGGKGNKGSKGSDEFYHDI